MSDLLIEDRGGVRILTMNRPDKRNALNHALTQALLAALHATEADEGVRSIVLTGAGSAFCAGADLTEFKDLTPDKAHLVESRAELHDEPAWRLFAPVQAGRHRHQRRGHGRAAPASRSPATSR